jgi:hypothetical protein
MEDAVRAAETEAIFREVNEVLIADDAVSTTVLCECANDACAETLTLPRADYERVRAYPTRFLVQPNHVAADIEVVVETHEDYWVIEKEGTAAEVAEDTDPRDEDG